VRCLPNPETNATEPLHVIALNARRDRAALLRLARRLRGPGRPRLQDLERLEVRLAMYQGSAGSVARVIQNLAPGPSTLPVAHFLAHPEFRRAPDRAFAAWAFHAARRGVPPLRAAERLVRFPLARTATPSFASHCFASIVCIGAARLAQTLARAAVADCAPER
jgi:hypothetical protein